MTRPAVFAAPPSRDDHAAAQRSPVCSAQTEPDSAGPGSTGTGRPLTGRGFLLIMVSGFAVIIAANLVLAVQAVRSFPGLETANSYIASQHFDQDRTAQTALGWDVTTRIEGNSLRLNFGPEDKGALGEPSTTSVAEVSAILGRPTHLAEDRALTFTRDGTVWRAVIPALDPDGPLLGRGNWNLRLVARANDGTMFRQRIPILIGARQ